MDRTQAIAELTMALKALFPYADSKDDPDRRRAADQVRCEKALAVLKQNYKILSKTGEQS